MEEQWRDIKFVNTDGKEYDYTGLYQVSNMGRVRNSRTGRILKTGKNKGYQTVSLNKNGKCKNFLLHRLVALMFIPNDDSTNKTQVNHINEDKHDNRVTNLNWMTPKENSNHGTRNERMSEKMKGKMKGKKGKPLSEEAKQKLSEAHKVKVICLETGQIFDSLKEAKQWLGKGNIAVCLAGNAKTAGKHPETGQRLHWEYYCED